MEIKKPSGNYCFQHPEMSNVEKQKENTRAHIPWDWSGQVSKFLKDSPSLNYSNGVTSDNNGSDTTMGH